jgi:hypothetical protein
LEFQNSKFRNSEFVVGFWLGFLHSFFSRLSHFFVVSSSNDQPRYFWSWKGNIRNGKS